MFLESSLDYVDGDLSMRSATVGMEAVCTRRSPCQRRLKIEPPAMIHRLTPLGGYSVSLGGVPMSVVKRRSGLRGCSACGL